MKVLHVRDTTGTEPPLVLHPEVTVIRSTDPRRREWLTGVLGRIADVPREAEGEVEAHGIRFDLDTAAMALLGLDAPVDAIVQAKDLPGHDPRRADAVSALLAATTSRDEVRAELDRHREAMAAGIVERDAAAAEVAELERGDGAASELLRAAQSERERIEGQRRRLEDERIGHEQVHADAVMARDLAHAARAEADSRLDEARISHREAIADAGRAAAEIEEARSVLDWDPTAALADARQRLVRAEEAAAEADPDHDADAVRLRLAELERRRTELIRLEEALGPSNVGPLADALDELLSASHEAPPVVAALALADTWRDLHQQIRALDAGVSPEELTAEARVTEARMAVTEAETDYNQPVLTPEQIGRVEAAHATVLEAQDRTEGRFGGGRSRKKLEEARSEERRVLERLGFSTYADYMMSSSSRSVGPANRAILETARQRLDQATASLRSLPGAGDRTRRRSELLARREAVSPRVAELIGHEPTGPEAEDELRELREPHTQDDKAMTELAKRLDGVGVITGPPPQEREDLVLLARSYLAEQRASEQRRTEVTEAIAALDVALSSLRDARERGASDPPSEELPELAQPVSIEIDEGDPARDRSLREARWAEVTDAREAAAAAEAAEERHRDSADRIRRLQEGLDVATAGEAEAGSAVEAAKQDAAKATGPALTEAEAALQEAEAKMAELQQRHDGLDADEATSSEHAGVNALIASGRERLEAAEHTVTETAAAEQASAASLADAEASLDKATHDHEAAEAAAQTVDRAALAEELDWALLGRSAALRSVGIAGSVPLVLDDPFDVLEDAEIGSVLDKVAAVAGAVQLVIFSDREAIARWASDLGPSHANVVAA